MASSSVAAILRTALVAAWGLVLLAAGGSPAASPGRDGSEPIRLENPGRYGLSGDLWILHEAPGAVRRKGLPDRVLLLGERFHPRSTYMRRLILVALGPGGGRPATARFPGASDGGYEPRMRIADFDGDGIGEVLVEAWTGEEGGRVVLHVFSLAGKRPRLLLNPDRPPALPAVGWFGRGRTAEVRFPSLHRRYRLDLKGRTRAYSEAGIYEGDALLRPVRLRLSGYGRGSAERTPSGTFLETLQVLKGISPSDSLAEVRVLWRLERGVWIPVRLALRGMEGIQVRPLAP